MSSAGFSAGALSVWVLSAARAGSANAIALARRETRKRGRIIIPIEYGVVVISFFGNDNLNDNYFQVNSFVAE
jgi:hypothetical protein